MTEKNVLEEFAKSLRDSGFYDRIDALKAAWADLARKVSAIDFEALVSADHIDKAADAIEQELELHDVRPGPCSVPISEVAEWVAKRLDAEGLLVKADSDG